MGFLHGKFMSKEISMRPIGQGMVSYVYRTSKRHTRCSPGHEIVNKYAAPAMTRSLVKTNNPAHWPELYHGIPVIHHFISIIIHIIIIFIVTLGVRSPGMF